VGRAAGDGRSPRAPAAAAKRRAGFALDLLTWLDRLTFPTERSWADPPVAERLSPAIFRAFAAAGTTTVLAYGVVYEAAMDVAFRAAEAHGIRAILGKVMMDRITYDPTIDRRRSSSGRCASRGLIARWHGAAEGRLGYAVTPRFAVSCTADCSASRRRSPVDGRLVADARLGGPGRDRRGRAAVPEASDYVDVYDRAGPGVAVRPRARDPPVATGAGSDRRIGDARGPLPGRRTCSSGRG
jgi:guanine deaminase